MQLGGVAIEIPWGAGQRSGLCGFLFFGVWWWAGDFRIANLMSSCTDHAPLFDFA